ncbi:5-oxoprolinase subunit PxpB [Pseudoflavitalea sp. G-6-1-2]|nr:5-oxoprolinase subunit PxpB [Pseudoflavitalea sp. G-6-1-2]
MDEVLNRKVMAMAAWFSDHAFEGLKNIIPAYSSLTVIYDPFLVKTLYQPDSTVYDWVKQLLQTAFEHSDDISNRAVKRHQVPVCYEGIYAPDLGSMAASLKLPEEEIIRIHASTLYRVFMIGFLPGFAYLGTVDAQIAFPRKPQPAPVMAGSVGIAGKQTGIYPLNSPGGWNIIGRIPMKMFDPNAKEPVWMNPGDEVQFCPVSVREFEMQQ